jgi:hypothetical protein
MTLGIGALVILSLLLLAGALYLKLRESGGAAPPEAQGRPAPAARKSTGPQEPVVAASVERLNWLIGVAGSVYGRAFLVGERTLTIGRGPENLIQVQGGDVSRIHCQLSGRSGAVQVVDMSSTNGTIVNGEPQARAELVDGDVLSVGESRFVYQVRGDFQDATTAWKAADPANFAPTGKVPRDKLEAKLREHGGDLAAAAADLGVDPDVLRFLLADRRRD